MSDSIENRRQSYRLDDEVGLVIVEHQEALENEPYHIAQMAFSEINQASFSNLQSIERKNPFLGQLIQSLNQKIEVLTRLCLSDKNYKKKQVNLSGSGIAFESKESFCMGDEVTLQLTLYPSYDVLQIQAKVSHVKLEKERYWLALQFLDLTSHQEQILNRHLFRKQARINRQSLEKEA